MLKEKDKVPDLEMLTDDNNTIHLSDFKGKKVILYFYPKDNTPGCTTEACSLNDHLPEIEAENAVVIGVSPDSVASHQKFRVKHNLNFILVSDPDKKIAETFGVWQEKSMFGKKYMGIVRTTFIIDENQMIEKIYDKVKVKSHGQDILNDLK